jgi:hypothetical protein
MVYLTIDQELSVRPDHGDIVVNEDDRIVEALLQASVSPGIFSGKSRNGV